MKKVFARLALGIALFLFLTSSTTATGVKPLVIDMDLSPGDTEDFELILTPGQTEEKVEFSFYRPSQTLTGGLEYEPVDETQFPAVDWIDLEDEEVTVYPGEEETVAGEVEVPFTAEGGTNTVIIMVEPQQSTQEQGGIEFMVRYAVRVNIRLDTPGVRPEAELEEFDLKADSEGRPQIEGRITNTSTLDYLVSAEATIRNQDRRLVERVNLMSPEGTKADSDETRMYPGSEVKYIGDVTTRLEPGEYTLRTFFRYGDYGQIIEEKTIEVTEDRFDFPSFEELGAFSLEPTSFELEVGPGAYQSQAVNLTNEIGDSVQVIVETSEVREEYEQSLLDWIEIRGQDNFELGEHQNRQVILTTAVPREVGPGSYHGEIIFKAVDMETEKIIDETEVPVSAVVDKDEIEPEITTSDLHTETVEEGQLLSLVVSNQGSIFVNPAAEVVLTTPAGEFIDRVQLSSWEEDKLLPLEDRQLRGTVEGLAPGEYKAEIKILDQSRELKTIEKTVQIN